MPTTVSRISQANVFLDGGSYLGRASEVKLPEVKFAMTEHKALGLFGALELPSGLEKMEAELTMTGLFADFQKAAANPFDAVNLQVRATQETYSGPGRIAQDAVILFLLGTFKSVPMGTFKQNEPVDVKATMSITYARLEIAGQVIFEVDVFNNIFKQNGADLMETYRANLGL